MSYLPIEDYGIIGDLHTAALVSIAGSIDFFCFPRFDSPSVFAALLDDEKGGRFEIAPALADGRRRQLYLPDSNILLTRTMSEDGVAEISDFMPIEDGPPTHDLVRRVKTVRGELRYRMRCQPRFDYARARHTVEELSDRIVFRSSGADGTALALTGSVPMRVVNGDAVAEFTLAAGESATFVLAAASTEALVPADDEEAVSRSFKETLNFWRRWMARSTYGGRWREQVNRSALTLKLLFSADHGSVVAAPTFGLPEVVGGERNWDYRYTWIRDASFVLYALSRLGYTAEAGAFMRWLAKRCAALQDGSGLRVLYATDGRPDVPETVLGHLEGYRGSSPVRIGNAAGQQLQLDIYGELLDAVYLYDKFGEPIALDLWSEIRELLAWLAENWRLPDEGIWEVRGGRHEFLYSRVMCWVAFDRAIRLARRRSLPCPLLQWLAIRDAIHASITTEFWSQRLSSFVQFRGGETLDAATLMMPLARFIGPTDPRWLSTLRAIEDHLVEDSLVHRYHIGESFPDGLEGREGTFGMCSFWYAECLSRAGDVRQARLTFEKMLGYANHLGLYAEELGARGEHLGNFPQAFTHMGLISAAFDIDRRLAALGGE